MLRSPPRALPPRPADSIEIFTSGPPDRPHIDLALIEAEQQSSGTEGGTAALVAALRAKAGELGCDALVIGSALSRTDTLANALTGYEHDREALFGTCVVYTSEQTAAADTQAPRVLLVAPPEPPNQ
ncbi:MAG TPA: hypothetical protein VG937_39335 [Polyangiaceae bacterium]|nr:hypothetical protein [Polyangiaceae bacterium]